MYFCFCPTFDVAFYFYLIGVTSECSPQRINHVSPHFKNNEQSFITKVWRTTETLQAKLMSNYSFHKQKVENKDEA